VIDTVEIPTANLGFSIMTSSEKVAHVAIAIFGLSGHVAISGCPSLSQSFGDIFSELAVVGNLDFVS